MADSYTKLFASITESTIWSEPAGTRLVWITMLAKANRSGEVFGSVPGLARLANVSLSECAAALETLESPDEWSRTPEHEGRRIRAIDGGWLILNHAKFDRLRSEIEAKERELERKRQWDRENRGSRPSAKHRDTPDAPPTKSDGTPTKSAPPPTATATPEEHQEQQRDNATDELAPKLENSRRGTRLPDGWRPSEAVREWAAAEFPAVSLEAVLAEFTDYWRAVPGQRGCKLDWDATFRNRVREYATRKQNFGRSNGTHREGVAERIARINAEADNGRRGHDIDGEYRLGP